MKQNPLRWLVFFIPVLLLSCSETNETKVKTPAVVFPEPVPQRVMDTVLTPKETALSESIETFFQTRYEQRQFYGNVLFAQKGKILYQGHFGYENFKTKTPLKDESIFQLASLSKPFTAYGMMLLVEKGQVNLHDNVKKYLPGFPYDNITVEMLLTHRSGLCNYMYFADENWPDRFRTPIHNDDVLRLFRQNIPLFYYPPDVRYDYSNTGYMLAASVIEKVSGQSFETYMQENVFGPIGMKNTRVYKKKKNKIRKLKNEVIGYTAKFKAHEDTYLNGVVGDKGIYSSATDLLKFDLALSKGTVLSKNWVDSCYMPRNEKRRNKDNYGYGWRIRHQNGKEKTIYHTGWWKGFRSYFIRDLNTGSVIIVLSNVKRGPFLKVAELTALLGLNRKRPAAGVGDYPALSQGKRI